MTHKRLSGMAVKTPESQKQKTPQSNKKTPNTKLGGKRPLPDDSEDDEPVLDQTSLKVKKMKQLEESDNSDPVVGSDEDSEEDVSSEDEDDDNEDEENDDDDMGEDEDGSDDESDAETDEDSGAEDKVPPKQINKTPAKGESKQAAKQKAGKVVTQTTSKSSAIPTTSNAPSSHVLLFNFDSLNENLLSGFLKKRGVNAQTIGCIYSPVALIGLPNDEAAKKAVSACSGATYNTRSLSAVIVNGDVSEIRTSKPKNPSTGTSGSNAPLVTVFATNLPKSLTTENIKKMIGIEPNSIRLITTGPKNRFTNACYIDCASEADAKKAFEALEGRSESGTTIKAFLRGLPQWSPITESSLVISNVPFTAGQEDMKKEFPTATSVESMRKGTFHLHFKSKEDREKAAKQANGKVMGGRPLRVVTPGEDKKTGGLVVSNLPFTAKVDDIRSLYPDCSWVTLQKRDDGKFSGTAIVSFKSEEATKKALDETPSKQLQGRQLRAHLEGQQLEESKKDVPAKKAAKQPASKEQKKAQVGSESEDDADDDDDEKDDGDDSEEDDDDAEQDDEAASEDDDEAGSEDDEDEAGSEDEDDSGDGDEPASDESDEESAEAPPAKHPKKDFTKQNGSGKPFRGFGGNKFQGGRGSPRGGRGGNAFRGGLYGAGSTCLNVFNVPVDLNEVDLRPYFPSARSIKCQPYGACVLQFRSERDCQAVYDECQTGKDVGGQTVQAQFSEGNTSLASHGQQRSEMPHSQRGQKGRYGVDNYGPNDGCVLKIHNLSWSVTDEELLQEYPRAVSANVMLTDQGRSRGWGTVTFSSPEDCQAAESSSSGRVISGRPIRVEIQDRESYRGQSHYDDGRRFRGGRGGGGFGREREVRRFDDRRGDLRRDRSPSPDRGQRRRGGGGGTLGGGSRGPRITSAVIRRAPGDSSDSDFDGR
ncbi:hypothetical protein SprV_0301207100 [Sparganum proliferum]